LLIFSGLGVSARRAAAWLPAPQARVTRPTTEGHAPRTHPPALGKQHFKKGRLHPRHQTPAQLRDLIARIDRDTRFPIRRILAQLGRDGITCGPARVRRIMAARQLKALQPRSFQPRTSDGRADRPSPNLLDGKPPPTATNRVWAGDITFKTLRLHRSLLQHPPPPLIARLPHSCRNRGPDPLREINNPWSINR